MKNITIISLLLVLLTACAAPVPPPTVTVVVSSSATSDGVSLTPTDAVASATAITLDNVLTPVMTATPDKQVVIDTILTESNIDWSYYEEHILPINESLISDDGVKTSVTFGFDNSMSRFVNKATLRDSGWNTEDGSKPDEAVHSFTKRMFYETWVAYQNSTSSGLETTSYEVWLSWLSEAQTTNTVEAWARVSTVIKADNQLNGSYSLTNVKIAPMADENALLPEDVSRVGKVVYVVINGMVYDDSTMKINTSGYGIGTELLPDGTLVVKISPATLNADTFWSYNITSAMSTVGRYLSTGLLSKSIDKAAMESLGVSVGRDRWQSFFKITPATENEKTFNG